MHSLPSKEGSWLERARAGMAGKGWHCRALPLGCRLTAKRPSWVDSMTATQVAPAVWERRGCTRAPEACGPSRAANSSVLARLGTQTRAIRWRYRLTATRPSWVESAMATAAGAAWVYTFSGGVWTQQGNKLVGTGAVGSAEQGISVALSADGNTAIVGGYEDDGGAGAAWVFTRSGGVWTQQGGKLVGTGAVGNAGQGVSVALSGDGNTAIVGGHNDNGGSRSGVGVTRAPEAYGLSRAASWSALVR